MESACFTTHPTRDITCPPPRRPCLNVFAPPPTVLVFPVMVLRAALHQLHHALLVLLLLQNQLLQFSLFIFCTPPLNYSPTRAQSFFFGLWCHIRASTSSSVRPLEKKKCARGTAVPESRGHCSARCGELLCALRARGASSLHCNVAHVTHRKMRE